MTASSTRTTSPVPLRRSTRRSPLRRTPLAITARRRCHRLMTWSGTRRTRLADPADDRVAPVLTPGTRAGRAVAALPSTARGRTVTGFAPATCGRTVAGFAAVAGAGRTVLVLAVAAWAGRGSRVLAGAAGVVPMTWEDAVARLRRRASAR
jgi:hypothetical protein